jgi:hypothetical protein
MPTLVEMTTSLRRPRSASPSMVSDWPPAYASAVSKKLTPAASERSTSALASSGPTL